MDVRSIIMCRLSRAALFAVMCGAWVPAYADCFDKAATWQHVNPYVLRAIAWQESHYHPDAKNVNTNGSIDYGLMQINTIHLPTLAHYGIGREELMSPCKNVYIAAWLLRQQINKYGNTWAAVGAYHSATPALRDQYANQIANILRRWHILGQEGKEATAAKQSPVIKDASNNR
jgi:soluble lytic murein transglycosylase-like protein